MTRRFRRNNNGNGSPITAVLFGIALFFGAFGVLFFNEGRIDISKVASDSVAETANSLNPNNQGELVAITGVLKSNQTIGDGELLTDGAYLQLVRSVEMYAWDEKKDTDSDSSITRYEYSRRWTSSPENSNNFNNSNGHYNPPMAYDKGTYTVENATMGAYTVDTNQLLFMKQEPVPLSPTIVQKGEIVDEVLFIGKGAFNDPEIGDLRISYTAFPNNQTVTVFGEQNESQLRPFTGPKDSLLYRAYVGDRADAIASMRSEFLTLLWGFRAGGIAMMWLGLVMMISPLTNLLGNVPILGGLGRAAVSIVAFIIAIVLGGITIIVSAILNSIVAMIVIAILVIGGGVYFWQKRSQVGEAAVSI